MRTMLRALAVVAAAAAVASAQDNAPLGQTSKFFVAVDTLNMRPTKNPLKSLRGRVVLFTAFQTWYQRCEEAVQDINGINDKYGPKGLTVLAFGEQERKLVEPWIAEKGARFSWCLIDTATAEQFKRDWPYPGQPYSFLIDVNGKIVWKENPRNMQNPNVLKPGTLEPLLAEVTQPPFLPKSLAAQQKPLDDGLWAATKKALEAVAAEGKLDKADLGWAKGTADWIALRHSKWMGDIDALCKKGWWWDAWEMANDFPRRFEGMDGADAAKAKADEIRATGKTDKTAEKDLAQGDDVAKAKDLAAHGKTQPARLILTRIGKEARGTRHEERAKEILETLPAK